ncbi:MAG: lipase maturation factor family protein [Chlamydiae bacterium]|nr:lipase maturation factor family protein [Chlamydiota bacterium]MBI3277717.1 lipase maturation factor family protein [Chlamydiota bacterium]
MKELRPISQPPLKPLMIFDGDCQFCRSWIEHWREQTQGKIDYLPFQKVEHLFPEIPHESFEKAIQFIMPDGSLYEGAEAIFQALAQAPHKRWMLYFYKNFPGFSKISEWAYQWIAQHRKLLITKFFFRAKFSHPNYFLTQWLFLRLLGIIYFIAFVSLGTQILGLVGQDGILPAHSFLEAVKKHFGSQIYHLLPTLAWVNTSDVFLKYLCTAGTFLSVLVITGIAVIPSLLILWVLYLSLMIVGQAFLSFQWDTLLLETGFLAVFFAPGGILPKWRSPSQVSKTILWLIRWLLFRLMFESGCVKLLSGDMTWRNLTALQYHYETQPLPTWIGWYIHHLPLEFHKASTFLMFVIELIIPWLTFLGRKARIFAFFSFFLLQGMILLTGNYCFFNLLTLTLCLSLLDDQTLQQWIPKIFLRRLGPLSLRKQNSFVKLIRGTFAIFIFLLSTAQGFGLFSKSKPFPKFVYKSLHALEPYHMINRYGLFAVMTQKRPEIIIEGSQDGENWTAYSFKWKPGDCKKGPSFVAPHQPRLDWQMWFAALGSTQNNPWILNFLKCLLEGSPEVLQLLKENPFPSEPPHYVRALLYQYHFSDLSERRQKGIWWTRELLGLYCPILSLKSSEAEHEVHPIKILQ